MHRHVVVPLDVVGRRILRAQVNHDRVLRLLDLCLDEIGNRLCVRVADPNIPAENLGKLERLVEWLIRIPHEPVLDLDPLVALGHAVLDIEVK